MILIRARKQFLRIELCLISIFLILIIVARFIPCKNVTLFVFYFNQSTILPRYILTDKIYIREKLSNVKAIK